MRIVTLAWILAVLLSPLWSMSADIPRSDEQQEPQLGMPRPPRTPLLFTRVEGNQKQSLEVRYLDPRTISVKFDKSGTCSRHEKMTAKIKPYWWLGAETDENESGEAVAVQEYVYGKGRKCSIYLRIDEGQWEQATVRESPGCSNSCPASAEPMYLKKR